MIWTLEHPFRLYSPILPHPNEVQFSITKPKAGLPGWHSGKESTGDMGSIPGPGGFSGGGNGSPLSYFNLENPMDRGAWKAIVYRVTKGWT